MSAVVPLYIKTAYHEEPSFANTKVVTSLFANSLQNGLDPNFKRCLEFRDATEELLKPYKDQFDFDELAKLAIDYSDGIVEQVEGVNQALIGYASEKNIPVLTYSQDNLGEKVEAFYDMICPSISEESEDE